MVKRLAVSTIFVMLCVNAIYSQVPKEVSPKELIERVASTYAKCDTYVDDGQVTEVFVRSNGSRTVIKPFSTAFVRPGEFRFEFKLRRGKGRFGEEVAQETDGWDSYIAWKNGDLVELWNPLSQPNENQTTLPLALAGLTGISSGSAIVIPQLLMPGQLEARNMLELTDARVLAEESVGGEAAYKLEGKDFRDDVVTFWINTQTMLIVKMHLRRTFKDFAVEHTTVYHPQVNVKIPADQLAFNPPKVR